MRLAVIVINYNGFQDTVECLDSLIGYLGEKDILILVDNFSKIEEQIQLKSKVSESKYEKVVHIQSERNRGFAGGNNLAFEYLREKSWKYALLLNNDTVLEHNTLEILIATAKVTEADLLGPKILYYNDPHVIWHGAGFYNSLRQGPVVLDLNKLDRGDTEILPAEFLTGCALLISRSAYEILGPLDERYFFIQEDWDYCFMAGKKGLKLLYVPAARVHHKVSRSSGGWLSVFSLYHQAKGRAYFIRKHYTGIHRVLQWMYLLTTISSMKLIQIVISPCSLKEKFVIKPLAWWRGCLTEIFGLV